MLLHASRSALTFFTVLTLLPSLCNTQASTTPPATLPPITPADPPPSSLTFPPLKPIIVDVNTNFSAEALGGAVNFAKSFIGTIQPNPLPLNTLSNYIGNGGDVLQIFWGPEDDNANELHSYFLPFIIAAGLGVFMAIVMPISFISFTCCRCCCKCCKCCDPDEVPETVSKLQKIIVGGLFIVLLVILFACALVALSANSRIDSAPPEISSTFTKNLNGIESFISQTMSQVSRLAGTDLDLASGAILGILDDISTVLGVPIQQKLAVQADPVISNLRALLTQLTQTQGALADINNDVSYLNGNVSRLQDDVRSVQNQLTDIKNQCQSFGPTVDCSDVPDASTLDTVADFRKVPNIDAQTSRINAIDAAEAQSELDSGVSEFNNIPARVAAETTSAKDNVTREVVSAQASTQEFIASTRSQLTSQFSQGGAIDNLKGNVSQTFTNDPQFQYFQDMRSSATTALAVLFLILTILAAIGFLIAVCPKWQLGVRLMMISVYLYFLILSFIFILVAVHFLAGTAGNKVCESFQTGDIYSEFLDDPDVSKQLFGEKHPLQDLLNAQDSSVTFQSLFQGCDNDQSLWSVANLNQIYDVSSQLPDLESQFNLTAMLDDAINLDGVVLMKPALRKDLNDFATSGISDIDFDEYNAQLNSTLLNQNISVYITQLDEASAKVERSRPAAQASGREAQLDQLLASIAQVRADILSMEVLMNTGIEPIRAALATQVATLQATAVTAPATINNTIVMADSFQNFISNHSLALIHVEVDVVANKTYGLYNQWKNHVLDSLSANVGKCKSLSQSVDGLVNVVCQYSMDGLASLWWSFGVLSCLGVVFLGVTTRMTTILRSHFSDKEEYVYRDEQTALV